MPLYINQPDCFSRLPGGSVFEPQVATSFCLNQQSSSLLKPTSKNGTSPVPRGRLTIKEMKNEVAAELKAGISKEELHKPAAPVAPAAPDALARQMAKGTMSMCYSSVATRLLQTTSFEQLDADGDGKVTKAELAAALTDMKVEGNEAEAAKEQIIQMADKDGDGVISKEELQQAKADVAAAEQPQPAAPVAPAAPDASTTQMAKGTMSMCYASVATRLMQTKSFEQLDADGDGKVTKEELAAALTDMKVEGNEAEAAKEQIIQMADKDGDGVISKEELQQAKADVAAAEQPQPAAPVAPAAPDASTTQMAKGTMSMCYASVATRLMQTKSFEQLDADGDGKVTKEELAAALTDMKVDGKEAEEAKEQIMQMADQDGDGVISSKELEEAKAKHVNGTAVPA